MHKSAKKIGSLFIDKFVNIHKDLTIIDIGSSDVNGSLKKYIDKSNKYIGIDLEKNKNVDIVLDNPYKLPFDDSSVDVVLSTSVFEHCEFFWVLFLEIMRVLKPNGIFYINAPSHGEYHTYPIDAWRFYPDAGLSLQNWAVKNKFNCNLIESFVLKNEIEGWNDFVAIFIKDKKYIDKSKYKPIGLDVNNAVNIICFDKKYKHSASWNSATYQIIRVFYKKIFKIFKN